MSAHPDLARERAERIERDIDRRVRHWEAVQRRAIIKPEPSSPWPWVASTTEVWAPTDDDKDRHLEVLAADYAQRERSRPPA